VRSEARNRYVSYFLHYPEQSSELQESQFSDEFVHIQRAFQWALQQREGRIPRFWISVKESTEKRH